MPDLPAHRDLVEQYMRTAESAVRRRNPGTALAALAAAAIECERWLASSQPGYATWREWVDFQRACIAASAEPSWLRQDPVGAGVRDTRRQLDRIVDRCGRVMRTWAETSAGAGDAFEDLLDAVWRCERDWTFDDRLAAL